MSNLGDNRADIPDENAISHCNAGQECKELSEMTIDKRVLRAIKYLEGKDVYQAVASLLEENWQLHKENAVLRVSGLEAEKEMRVLREMYDKGSLSAYADDHDILSRIMATKPPYKKYPLDIYGNIAAKIAGAECE